MKKISFFLIAIVLSLPQLIIAQCTGSCTVTINGNSGAEMNFASGTYCFTGGTFTGSISGMAADAIICVGPNASFLPSNVNATLKGTIKVYGTCQLPTINIGDNFTVENYKNFVFKGNLNFNGSNVKIYNAAQGYMQFQSSFQISNNALVSNEGSMQFDDDFNTNGGTTVTNTGSLRLNGNFNPSSTVINQGLVVAQKQININSGASVTNSCKFVSVRGFVNGGYFSNNGLVWVTSANEGESHIQNNSIMEIGSRSLMRGIQFTNNATVRGSCRFHFTGTTRQQGTFDGTNGANPITFYDASQYMNMIFDFPQNNQLYTNTIRTQFVPEDTSNFNCTSNILPLQLNGFDAQAVQNKEVLLTWQTLNESSLKSFTIERSDKALAGNWQYVGSVVATGNSTITRNYQITDKQPLAGTSYYRLKAIDIDGKETFSALRTVNLNTRNTLMQIYPTLIHKGGVLKITTPQSLNYQVLDISGKNVMQGKVSSGTSLLTLSLSAGSYIVVAIDENNMRQYSKIIIE